VEIEHLAARAWEECVEVRDPELDLPSSRASGTPGLAAVTPRAPGEVVFKSIRVI
jgi:hypothetical protein